MLNLVTRNEAPVYSGVERVVFTDDRFAQQGGSDGDIESFDQAGEIVLQSEPPDLCAG